MTSDFKPTSEDIWRLIEKYGSIAHAAIALGVPREDLEAWLNGSKPISWEDYDRLLTLVMGSKSAE